MKKTFVFFGIVATALLFSGCGSKNAALTPAQQGPAPEPSNAASGVVSSIKDAIGLGTKMQCTMSSKNSAAKVVYIEGTKIKSTSEINNKKQNIIFDGEATFVWTEGEATGLKMTKACLQDLKASLPEQQKNLVDSSITNVQDKINSDTSSTCTPVADIDFTIPAAVTFTDQCQVMKKTLDSMKNIKLPAGVKVPTSLPGAQQ